MKYLSELFEKNRVWSLQQLQEDPDYFQRLVKQQAPKYLWIGCSDSRVPANQITGLNPGEVFVHRNIANVIVHTDLNCLSVVHYAIQVLKVQHVIVCGHYGCGGVRAALDGQSNGMIDNWLRHIEDVRDRHADLLENTPDYDSKWAKLCELNVIEQVRNLARTTPVSDAWKSGQELFLHGWIYGLRDGRLIDLEMSALSRDELELAYAKALSNTVIDHIGR
ncbi:carbonate dehydratase [Dechloromonas hortensis]|uniref:carbonate dehydratase n=1 Tax=Dechloromonas hortensis TaxID=337779 RepID=UPI0012914B83|nr:carbonate dehydratase [Dechloromonas hortensis]